MNSATKKSRPTSKPVSRWTRRERMRSRAWLRDGFRESKGTIQTWWDCRWRWCTECFESGGYSKRGTETSSSKQKLGFLFRIRLLAVFDRRLEIPNSLTQSLAEIGQLAGTKDQQSHGQNQQDFRQSQFAWHVRLQGVDGAYAAPGCATTPAGSVGLLQAGVKEQPPVASRQPSVASYQPTAQEWELHTFQQPSQQGGAAGEFGDADGFVHGVSSVADAAQPVEGRNAEAGGEVSVGTASDSGFAELPAEFAGNLHGPVVEHGYSGGALHRRAIHAT